MSQWDPVLVMQEQHDIYFKSHLHGEADTNYEGGWTHLGQIVYTPLYLDELGHFIKMSPDKSS